MTDAIVRPAVEEDLDGLLELYRHLNPDDPAPPRKAAEAAWRGLLGSGLTTVFIVETDRRPVASCTLIVVPNLTRGARSYAVIENVVTHAAYRRRGFGRVVLRAAVDTAWSAGCYKVMLATGSRQEATLGFYEGAGFERGGKTFFQARRATGA